jgi:hypothetical protein
MPLSPGSRPGDHVKVRELEARSCPLPDQKLIALPSGSAATFSSTPILSGASDQQLACTAIAASKRLFPWWDPILRSGALSKFGTKAQETHRKYVYLELGAVSGDQRSV